MVGPTYLLRGSWLRAVGQTYFMHYARKHLATPTVGDLNFVYNNPACWHEQAAKVSVTQVSGRVNRVKVSGAWIACVHAPDGCLSSWAAWSGRAAAATRAQQPPQRPLRPRSKASRLQIGGSLHTNRADNLT